MNCKICGNEQGNILHKVPERILNKGDVFQYLECKNCGCWVLADEVNVGEYYPPVYNPYNKNLLQLSILDRIILSFKIRKVIHSSYNDFQKVLKMKNLDILLKRLCGLKIKRSSSILDVGCANGHWLDQLYDVGYHHITGVDLFVPKEKMTNKSWKFIQSDIFSINGKFDLITLNHSFEHMYEPLAVLKHIRELMDRNSKCQIALPLVGGGAHKMFGEYYCQLDAPRHIYMQSRKSMQLLCEKAGLKIVTIHEEPSAAIFHISDGYKRTNKSHSELIKMKRSGKWDRLAENEVKKKNADHVVYVLQRDDAR